MICGYCKCREGITLEHVRTRACQEPRSFTKAEVKAVNKGFAEALEDPAAAFVKDFPNFGEEQIVRIRTRVSEDGMYRFEGTIYKVQTSPNSGRQYAKRLNVIKHDDDAKARIDFEYMPGAISMLAAEDRMSVEDAKAFGALYGTCCVCGRTLTNETSIEAGIGPVCGGKV